MRLDGLTPNPNVAVGQTQVSRPATTATDYASSAAPTETFESTDAFESFVKELQTIPLIRADVAAEAADKLAAGDFDGPDAIDKVVQGIMETANLG